MLNRKSCFPEIAGDAAIYFNMDATNNDIEEHLENLLSMSVEERTRLLDKQRERLTHFSWKQSAMQLVQVYKSLI
jgi:glycosyltransferase involved in cell wall biosynthesis